MQAPNVYAITNNSVTRPSSCRLALKGASLAVGIFAGLFAAAAFAQVPPQPEGCSVGSWLSSFSVEDYVVRLAVNGTDIAACAEYLELQHVDNRLVLTRDDYMALLAAARSQQGDGSSSN